VTVEVAVLRYLNALPCGVGVATELRQHLGGGRLHSLAGASLHYAGQRGCAVAVSVAARRIGLNLFEANGTTARLHVQYISALTSSVECFCAQIKSWYYP
jgi:hypothetical protein